MAIFRLDNGATFEGSSNVITATFKDDSGALAVPNNMYWTLSDRFGSIINSRNKIDFELDNGTGTTGTLSSAMQIFLNGADLDIASKALSKVVILTVEGTYEAAGGVDLPYKSQCSIEIKNLVSFTRYKIVAEPGTFTLLGGAATFTVA